MNLVPTYRDYLRGTEQRLAKLDRALVHYSPYDCCHDHDTEEQSDKCKHDIEKCVPSGIAGKSILPTDFSPLVELVNVHQTPH